MNALHKQLIGYQAMLSTLYHTVYEVCLALPNEKWTVGPMGEGEVYAGSPKQECLFNADTKIDRYNLLVSGYTAFNLMKQHPYAMGIYKQDQKLPLVFATSLLLLEDVQFFTKGKIADALVVATQTRDKVAVMAFDWTQPQAPVSEAQVQANKLTAGIASKIAQHKKSTATDVLSFAAYGALAYAAYKIITEK